MSNIPGFIPSGRNDWETPSKLFAVLDAEFGFTLDVAASDRTAKCPKFFTPEEDGLKQSWRGHTCWLNPPYGGGIGAWLEKAYNESRDLTTTVVALVPARIDAAWFHEWFFRASEVSLFAGRIQFLLDGVRQGRAPMGAILLVFRNDGISRPVLRSRVANPA